MQREIVSEVQDLYDANQANSGGKIVAFLTGNHFQIRAISIRNVGAFSNVTTGDATTPTGTKCTSGGLMYSGGSLVGPVDAARMVGCEATLSSEFELRVSDGPTRIYEFDIPIHFILQYVDVKRDYNITVFGLDQEMTFATDAMNRYPNR
jgi:hypothetical protein